MNFVKEGVLGEGGMGVVYGVLDPRLRRRAALKVAKGAANDPARLARFQREALITAKLDHPGIPPVYDAGRTPEGEPFLLMRLVDGRSLDELLKNEEDRPARHELLAMLVKVSEAVAYANSKGIVHRDLKPSNIMVGKFGEVLVLDWGIARSSEQAESEDELIRQPTAGATVTQAGAILGTFGYMAPEQCRGEPVDARADVFSLGAILVELLTGEPPIKGSSVYDLIAATTAGQVAYPRTRDRSIPAELDAIARRALALDRGARYESAAAFGEDVRAFLEGRRVAAHRYGPLHLALRAARRHPTLVVAALLSLAAAVALGFKNRELARTLSVLETEKAERAKASREKEAAEEGRLLLAKAWARSREGAKASEVVELVDAALAKNRTEDALLEGGRLLVATGDLAGGRKLLRACADEFLPGYVALHAIHETEVTDGSSRFTPALRELATRARARRDTNAYTCMIEGADAMERGDRARALAAADQACALVPRLPEAWVWHAQTRSWTGDLPGAFSDAQRAVDLDPSSAPALIARGDIRLARGDVDGALADLDRAVAAAPGSPQAWNERGNARSRKGDLEGAVADYTKALEIEPASALLLANRAHAKRLRRDFDASIADYDKALALEPGAARLLLARGETRSAKGDFDGALEDFEASLAKRPDFTDAIASRGATRLRKGDRVGGLADLDRALELDPHHANARLSRGDARDEAGDFKAAIDDYAAAIDAAPSRAAGWEGRGTALAKLGSLDEALTDLDRAIELGTASAKAYFMRGYVRAQRNDLPSAIRDATRAIELDPSYADAWNNRGYMYLQSGDEKKAISDFDRAVTLGCKGPVVWLNRGRAHAARKEQSKAIADFSQAISIEPTLADAWLARGLAHKKKKDEANARRDLEKFLELAPRHPEARKAREALADLGK